MSEPIDPGSKAAAADENSGAGVPTGPAADPAPLGRNRATVLALVAVAIIALDIITKTIVVANLEPGQPHRILGGAVYFTLYRNAGAAFSTGSGATWIFAVVAAVVAVVIIRMARKLRSVGWAIGLGLVLGGALGNLIDRIFRSPGFLRGHVVDFISLFEPSGEHFAVFNVADAGLTIGVVVIVLTVLFGVEIDGTKVPKRAPKNAQ